MCYSNEVQVLLLSCLKITELIQYSGDKSAIHICVSEQINHNWAKTQPVQSESSSELKTHATYFNIFQVHSKHRLKSFVLYNEGEKGLAFV